jgi:phosphatidylglycerophosphate synthase/branched-subunit amino acid transport protein
MGFITPDGFKHLDAYKYVSGGYSYLDNVFNHFWEAVAKCLPMWLAPNAVTLIGFVFMAASYLVMIPYDLTLSNDIPRWTFFFSAFCQFLYQTLDAVDGKQARRTKSSSPLGQLFDHGCDSFSVTFLICSVAEAAKFGEDSDMYFALVSIVCFCFWISNWSEYHTKVLRTHMYNFGTTEGQLVIIGVLLVSGIFGQDAWATKISDMLPGFVVSNLPSSHLIALVLSKPVKFYFLYGFMVIFVTLGAIFFISTLRAAKDKSEAILQNIPIAMLFGLNYLWSSTELYHTKNSLVSVVFGLNFSLFTCRLIVCSLTEMRFPKFHKELVFFTIVTAVLRRDLFMPNLKFSFDIDNYILIASLVFTVLSSVQWSGQVIEEITSHLGIYCFSLEKRPKKKIE